MTLNLGYLFLISVAYLLVLFLIAYATERGWIPERMVRHPLTYTLSLGVYATSWSYYGSVGFAEEQGLMFLSIYIGPTLAFILTPVLLTPLVRLTRDYQLTSIADLFAFRYSSQFAGVAVTLFMLAGSLPYIALQIRAVSESIRVLSQNAPPLRLGFVFCITLTIFAILFGARHISPREKHAGLVMAIAFESVIKLTAILGVALFAVFGVFGGPTEMERWLDVRPELLRALYDPVEQGSWLTLCLLSFAAAFLLPRQFHMAFVENMDSRALPFASWAFPLFLLLFNLAIPPILWAGQAFSPNVSADYYVLGVSLLADSPLLPIIAFIGGISAASAMVIVASLALSQMALNHILLPASYPDPAVNMYRWLLWGRRMLIGLIILTGYGLYVILEQAAGLVRLGLTSFVAVAQFLPGIVGVLYWPRATRVGFLAGLTAGALVWFVTLLLPLLQEAGLLHFRFNLMEWMGVADATPWKFVTFWSLSLNSLLFVALSLATRPDAGERRAIAACFQDFWSDSLPPAASPQALGEQLARIIGPSAAANELKKALEDLGISSKERRPVQLQALRERIERNLSGMLGPTLARMIIEPRPEDVDENTRSMLAEHIHFVEERLEQSRSRLQGLTRELDRLRRYHQQILQDLPLGVCSLSAAGEILNWNQVMEKLSGIDRQMAIGGRVTELPQPWADLLDAFLNQNKQHIYKTRINIEARPRWFNLHKAAIENSVQAPGENAFAGGVVVLVEDLTEIQTLESELIHSERLASIGRLAAGVAHEIGNPVTGIACIAQNLRHEDDPKIVGESVGDILEQTRRISDIVQTLVTFSHGGLPEGRRFTRFKLGECIADARRLVQLSRNAKHFSYALDVDENLWIEGDRQRLLQVFVNLLSNACDASQSGDRIQISACIEDTEAVIKIIDQGEGIPEEIRERVFEPFFTTKDPGKGTGLGLPLVYNIVHDHDGSVAIDSELGRGARVTVRLPLRSSEKNAAQTLD